MAKGSKRGRKAPPRARRRALAPGKADVALLKRQLAEAHDQQAATADILRAIASSPGDTDRVLENIMATTARLFGCSSVSVRRVEGDALRLLGAIGASGRSIRAQLPKVPVDPKSLPGAVVLEQRQIHIADLEHLEPRMKDWPGLPLALKAGARSGVGTPLKREGRVVGVMIVYRDEQKPFSTRELAQLANFADQAVIAIENVRLFNETKEALERQTATAEILKVIARSTSDVQPVFDAIVQSAARLFAPASVGLNIHEGDLVHLRGTAGPMDTEESRLFMKKYYPIPFDPVNGIAARSIANVEVIEIPDTEARDIPPPVTAQARAIGFRSITQIPLVREGKGIGSLGVAHPEQGFRFMEKQLELMKTFADQAVIAIENVRLFNETKEALERQTATAEILKVISSSPTDTQPVFDAIVQSALRLFDGLGVGIAITEGNLIQLVASGGGIFSIESARKRFPMPLTGQSVAGRSILERAAFQVADTEAASAPEYARGHGRALGFRAIASAPMMRDNVSTGSVIVMRKEPGLFSDKQMGLLQTFADQAVIAIENVRLFKELQSRTEALTKSVGQLTALGEVGRAISSTLDLETVLKTVVTHAMKLTALDAGVIYEYDAPSDRFELRASENFDDESVADLRGAGLHRGEGAVGSSVATREPVQVHDTHAPSYPARLRGLLERSGFRAVLAVPLLREDQTIGALMMLRKAPGAFAPDIVDMLKTFASQSALAIQNARLFREIAEKSRQLETASRHKSDFLASMSHELRTPLNAILGFNEMILGQIYGEVPKDMQEPLEDIQKSGKHLLRLINNVLDLAKIEAGRMELALSDYSVHDTVESVRSTLRPLAAEKGLEFVASLPDDLPLAYGDGGRITQCLMNLAGNSLKFTKAGKVEISVTEKDGLLTFSVTDTGIGIPRDKIGSLFTEFKQTDATIASEYGGTGLGLSISRQFIEMHGGRIWVESEPGRGSAFIFEIPLRVKAT